jgi:Tol biopolymer transport system component
MCGDRLGDRNVAHPARIHAPCEQRKIPSYSRWNARRTDDSAPAFSPDGTQIALVRNGAVSILDLATGDVRMLGPGDEPSWNPDGSKIYAWHTS